MHKQRTHCWGINPYQPPSRTRIHLVRPPCSPSSHCVSRGKFSLLRCSTMASPREDVFVVTSSTGLQMAESLLRLLDTVVGNLPEAELRRIRNAMEHSVRLADDLLFSISISSGFEMLTTNDGVCASVVHCVHLPSKQCPPPSAEVPLPQTLVALVPLRTILRLQ